MKQSKIERFDYHFRMQPPLLTPEAILLEYLKNNGSGIFSHKEMVLSALKAYWLPFAYKAFLEQGHDLSEEDLRLMAYEASLHLQHQLIYIQQAFRLSDRVIEELSESDSNGRLSTPALDCSDDDSDYSTSEA